MKCGIQGCSDFQWARAFFHWKSIFSQCILLNSDVFCLLLFKRTGSSHNSDLAGEQVAGHSAGAIGDSRGRHCVFVGMCGSWCPEGEYRGYMYAFAEESIPKVSGEINSCSRWYSRSRIGPAAKKENRCGLVFDIIALLMKWHWIGLERKWIGGEGRRATGFLIWCPFLFFDTHQPQAKDHGKTLGGRGVQGKG